MKSCSLSVRIAAPVEFLGSMLYAVSGVGWGMHIGEELLPQSSR